MESITANEVAGLGVGALLLAAALAAPKVDAFIARGQRRLVCCVICHLLSLLVQFNRISPHLGGSCCGQNLIAISVVECSLE